MCNDINCKNDQVCVVNADNVAICIEKLLPNAKEIKKSKLNSSKKCKECTNLRTNDIYCASNNRSYSSLCELIKFNCKHSSDYYPICQDECPCNKINLNKKLKLYYLWKYVNNNQNANRLNYQSKQARNDKQLKQNNKANRLKNRPNKHNSIGKVCTKKELNEIGQRLFQWFGVILKNQLLNENSRSTKILNKIRSSFIKNCNEEVNYVFLTLDLNKNLRLSMDELLEYDKTEKCLKQYMDSCDLNADGSLTNNEFCDCFIQFRPCFKQKNSLLFTNKLNSQLINCDANGFFNSLQCNKFTKFCWCVDKNGNEIANTRKLGKISCGKYGD